MAEAEERDEPSSRPKPAAGGGAVGGIVNLIFSPIFIQVSDHANIHVHPRHNTQSMYLNIGFAFSPPPMPPSLQPYPLAFDPTPYAAWPATLPLYRRIALCAAHTAVTQLLPGA